MLSGTLTIPAALSRVCHWFADDVALVEGDRHVTYGELDNATRRVAGGLQALGVMKGDRVVYLSEPSADHAIAYYGAQRLGAVTANLHERESADHLSALLERLGAKALFFSASHNEMAHRLSSSRPDLHLVQLGSGAKDAQSLADMISTSPPGDEPDVSEADRAVIQLSSGSTGQPKALVHCHASVLHTWHGGLNMWNGISSRDRYLNAFSSSFSVWLIHAGAFLNQGGTVVLQVGWDPSAFLGAMARRTPG
jgi:acyl-CoA synthetase (AMP-forming)/AMP-acid ligase II